MPDGLGGSRCSRNLTLSTPSTQHLCRFFDGPSVYHLRDLGQPMAIREKLRHGCNDRSCLSWMRRHWRNLPVRPCRITYPSASRQSFSCLRPSGCRRRVFGQISIRRDHGRRGAVWSSACVRAVFFTSRRARKKALRQRHQRAAADCGGYSRRSVHRLAGDPKLVPRSGRAEGHFSVNARNEPPRAPLVGIVFATEL